MTDAISVNRETSARIPTEVGVFHLHLYSNSRGVEDPIALVVGDVRNRRDVLTRVHSECFTGEVVGSLRCDCGEQLDESMARIANEERGVIIYLRQEGRGIGLLEKLRAYNLQDIGYDTVEANEILGHAPDERDYTVAARILDDLQVQSVRLLTNNPVKVESLQGHGIGVAERVALHPSVHSHNEAYLATKAERMRHVINVGKSGRANGPPENGRGKLRSGVRGTAQIPDDRPFATVSYAQSLDGSLTTARGESVTLSGAEALTLTHRLRAHHDGILVGIGTVLSDDPRLTVRRVQGVQPRPVVVDSKLRFPASARMLELSSPSPWIFTTPDAPSDRQRVLESKGIRVFRVSPDSDGHPSIETVYKRLREEGIETLMVEGGARLLRSILSRQLADRLVVTIASTLIGGLGALQNAADGPLPSIPTIENASYTWYGDDLVVRGDLVWTDEQST